MVKILIFLTWILWEKIDNFFYKFALGVNKKATNLAVREELGRYPIEFDIWHRALNNFFRICKMNGLINKNTFVSDAYLLDHLLLKEEPQREISFLS